MAKIKTLMRSAKWPGFDRYMLEGPLPEVIGTLSTIYAALPEDARKTAYIDIDNGYDGYWDASIRYDRPETDAEIEARVAAESAYKRQRRTQYEQLKKEFG